MNVFDKIKIFDLLREREELFSTVFDCETRIESILGISFDFDVPDLISQKTKKKMKEASNSRSPVRRLKPDLKEDAYLLEYSLNGKRDSAMIRDYKLLCRMMESRLENFRLYKVSSINFVDDENYREINLFFNIENES